MPETFTIEQARRAPEEDWHSDTHNKDFLVYHVSVRGAMAAAPNAQCSRLPKSPALVSGMVVEGELVPQTGEDAEGNPFPPKFKVLKVLEGGEPRKLDAASNIAAPTVPGSPVVSYGEQRVNDYERQLMIVHQHSQTVAASVLGEGGPEQVMQLAQILTDDVLDLPTRLAERKRAEALAKEHDEEIPF